MEIVQFTSALKKTDGEYQFSYVQVFARQDSVLYSGKWHDRSTKPNDISDLTDLEPIETKDRGPEVKQSWTVAQPPGCYVKTPSLIRYATKDLDYQILREVEMCEALRTHPHPNIAVYYGCQETRGRVSGLCFKKYTTTLADKVDPGHLNKREFLSSERTLVDDSITSSISGILEAIHHLHSLGFVHNDVTPANIMFDEDGTPILIDFSSCRRVGESLTDTKTARTHEWHDHDVNISKRENDLNAIAELMTWLAGVDPEQFLF